MSHRRTKSFEPFILRTIRPKSTNTLKKRGVNTWADGGRVSVGFSLCYKSSFHYGKMTSVTHFVEKADLEKKSSEGTTSISAPSCLRNPLGSDSDSWTAYLFAGLATRRVEDGSCCRSAPCGAEDVERPACHVIAFFFCIFGDRLCCCRALVRFLYINKNIKRFGCGVVPWIRFNICGDY